MSESTLAALGGALIGAVVGGVITFLISNRQLRVMKEQLRTSRWPMLQPIIEYLSRLLTGSRLDNPSTAWTHELRVDWSTLGYQLTEVCIDW